MGAKVGITQRERMEDHANKIAVKHGDTTAHSRGSIGSRDHFRGWALLQWLLQAMSLLSSSSSRRMHTHMVMDTAVDIKSPSLEASNVSAHHQVLEWARDTQSKSMSINQDNSNDGENCIYLEDQRRAWSVLHRRREICRPEKEICPKMSLESRAWFQPRCRLGPIIK